MLAVFILGERKSELIVQYLISKLVHVKNEENRTHLFYLKFFVYSWLLQFNILSSEEIVVVNASNT